MGMDGGKGEQGLGGGGQRWGEEMRTCAIMSTIFKNPIHVNIKSK